MPSQPVPFRPAFYNIPGWAEAVLYLSTAVMLIIFVLGLLRHISGWRRGQPAQVSRNWGERFKQMVIYGAPGQKRLWERLYPGSFHVGILWGFIVLFIGTALATVDYDIGVLLFDTKVLTGPFYLGYELVLDLFGLAFIVGLLAAMYRRYAQHPEHIRGAWGFALFSLLAINVTGFLVEGYRLALQQPEWARWSPVGYAIGQMLLRLDLVDGIGRQTHLTLWLIHMLFALGFLALIPYHDIIHLFTSPLNIFFGPLKRELPVGAALVPINIEETEIFGVGQIDEFTWKQRLGFDACTRCGRCSTVCPANMAGTALDPKQVIVKLGHHLQVSLDGREELPSLHDDVIQADELWACTTCMACVRACPVFIEIVDDIVDLRRYLTLSEGAVPHTAAQTLRNMMTTGNPWGYPHVERTKWAEDLDVPIIREGEHVEYLYWVGCAGAYDARNQKISRAVVQILKAAGVQFAVMAEEKCSGDSARRLGEEYLYQTLVQENIANLDRFSFDRIVTHCPHCFNTLKNEYPQFGGNYEVVHHAQLIEELITEGCIQVRLGGQLQPEGMNRNQITFHDSCYLGRYNGIMDAPRTVIRARGDLEFVEMERIRENGLCCGAGGGQMWMEVPSRRDVNLIRLEEAMGTGAGIIGTTCPFCMTMMEDAKAREGVEEVAVKDVAELVVEGLES